MRLLSPRRLGLLPVQYTAEGDLVSSHITVFQSKNRRACLAQWSAKVCAEILRAVFRAMWGKQRHRTHIDSFIFRWCNVGATGKNNLKTSTVRTFVSEAPNIHQFPGFRAKSPRKVRVSHKVFQSSAAKTLCRTTCYCPVVYIHGIFFVGWGVRNIYQHTLCEAHTASRAIQKACSSTPAQGCMPFAYHRRWNGASPTLGSHEPSIKFWELLVLAIHCVIRRQHTHCQERVPCNML